MIGGNWNNVQGIQDGGGGRLQPGGYVIVIARVTNRLKKQDLECEYDIAEGEHAGYYKELSDRLGFWGGKFYASYGQRAQGFFKGFLDSLAMSNPGRYVIRPDGSVEEQDLVGLRIGIVLGREQYMGNDGTVKTRLYKVKLCPVYDIQQGNYTVPEDKKLAGVTPTVPDQKTGVGGVVDMSGSADIMADPAGAFEQIETDLPF